jgi:hypothetical protein
MGRASAAVAAAELPDVLSAAVPSWPLPWLKRLQRLSAWLWAAGVSAGAWVWVWL